jgi:calcium-dependent protein kinase
MCHATNDDSINATGNATASATPPDTETSAISRRYHRAPRKLEDDYDISAKENSRILGSGCNGDVLLATSKADPARRFAVKSMQIPHSDKESFDQLMQEVNIHLSMDHPHVSRLFDVYESADQLHLVMECLEGKDLFDRLSEAKQFSESEARVALQQILLMLDYMHSHNVVHRDVKLENLVYDKTGSTHLKLIDFGASGIWDPGSRKYLRDFVGTPEYAAPEILFDRGYTSQCDLWSLGVVGYCLLTGTMPFTGSVLRMRDSIRRGVYNMTPERWKGISEEAKSFIKSLITVDPTERLSAKDALDHPWIRKGSAEAPTGIVEALEALHNFDGVSKFRRACTRMLACYLPNEDEAKVRDVFLSLTTCSKGTITLEGLSKVLSDRLHVVGRDEALRVFQAFGYGQDQEIKYSDFLAAMLSTRIHLNENLLRSTFHWFDGDGSGFMSIGDLCASFGYEEDHRSIQATFQNNSRQMNCDDFIDYFLDTSCRCAELVERRRERTTLSNVLAAWRESKHTEEVGIEQKGTVADGTFRASLQALGIRDDVELNCQKHVQLMAQFQAVQSSIRRDLKKLDFAGLRKLAAIRCEMCQLGW